MEGEASEAAIAAFLTALAGQGRDGRRAGRRGRGGPRADGPLGLDPPPAGLLDTCGTGGDGADTVNVSTATAIVVAACGVPVAKHGNRSASGNSGSAEVLAELGIAIDAEAPILHRCLAELGITFLFAPGSTRPCGSRRRCARQLPFRTLFNLVGPLANPARPEFQLVGVSGDRQAELMAEALARLGTRAGRSSPAARPRRGLARRPRPASDGSSRAGSGARSGTPRTSACLASSRSNSACLRARRSADRTRDSSRASPGRSAQTVLANSAAALLVAGQVATLIEGVERAARAIDSGEDAGRLLERWGRVSRRRSLIRRLGTGAHAEG